MDILKCFWISGKVPGGGVVPPVYQLALRRGLPVIE